MIDVLLQRFAEYDYIVEFDKGKLPFNAGHDHILCSNISGALWSLNGIRKMR